MKWTDGEPVQQQTTREIEMEVFYSQLLKETPAHPGQGGSGGLPRRRAARKRQGLGACLYWGSWVECFGFLAKARLLNSNQKAGFW